MHAQLLMTLRIVNPPLTDNGTHEPSDSLLAVDDRLYGCRPITRKFLVSKESELHPAATE